MKYLIFFSCLCSSLYTNAEILPKEGSILNYRLVGFSFMMEKTKSGYTIEVAAGKHNVEETFLRNIFISKSGINGDIVLEVPDFGKDYTWRVIDQNGNKKTSQFYHFSTHSEYAEGVKKQRLNILQPSDADINGMYIGLNNGGTFYDTKGKLVAFLPQKSGMNQEMRSLAVTGDGTLTYIHQEKAYEVNLNGDVIWKAPGRHPLTKDTAEDKFHHELVKLRNGNYMVMGSEYIMTKQVVTKDTSYTILSEKGTLKDGFKMGEYGTLIEFDSRGKIVWSWRDAEHIVGSDYDYFVWSDSLMRHSAPPPPPPPPARPAKGPGISNAPIPATPLMASGPGGRSGRMMGLVKYDPHANSFFFDEENKSIYICYRNINRVIKIDYRTGDILKVYGATFKLGLPSTGREIFCNPHGMRRSAKGYLYFFNNNSCRNSDSLPQVIVLREPKTKGGELEVIWKYTCNVEGNIPKRFPSGGNVIEQENGTFFVNSGSIAAKLFIVDKDKKEIWSARPEFYEDAPRLWLPLPQYRATTIQRNEMEAMIWNAERNLKPGTVH